MSYLQEAQIPAARVELVERRSGVLPARAALALLLILAFLHGALYAAFLPPWGLIDEAQHLHYIQVIAEEQKLPSLRDSYLSDEIVSSLFATRRWQTFHWTPPPAPDPQVMGLEGHSYEAYQPPLFYLLMTPAYWALPDDMLSKVFGLRVVVLALSLITVWATYRTAEKLLPQYPNLPFWAGLVLVAIPERAFATSRINNDVLLEVVAALFFLALTYAIVSGFSRRRSILLGVLLGMGVWVKISAGLLGAPLLLLFWMRRRDAGLGRHLGWVVAAGAPFALLLVGRNLWSYGDLTGFGSFDRLGELAPADRTLAGIVQTLISLPNHLWLIWWKGSEVGSNVLLTIFYAFMAIVVLLAWRQLIAEFWPYTPQSGVPQVSSDPSASTLWNAASIYGLSVLLYALFVLVSYYEGMIPLLQGRFMLPVIVPFVLLLVWGLWLLRSGQWLLLATVTILWIMGLFALFGNLIPYYYYWSEVIQGTMPSLAEMLRGGAVGRGELMAMVYRRALEDKPSYFAPLLLVLPCLYGVSLIATFWVALRSITRPFPTLSKL